MGPRIRIFQVTLKHYFKKRKTNVATRKRNRRFIRVRQGIHIQKPTKQKVGLTGNVHRPVTKTGVEGRGLDI